MFTKIGYAGSPQILITGDSCGEQFLTSFHRLTSLAFTQKKEIIVSGTSSFSPSLFQAQLQILRNDYEIYPMVQFVVIDQTDLYDEICRYRKKIISNAKEFGVSSFPFGIMGPYDVELALRISQLNNSNEAHLIRLIKLMRLRNEHKKAQELTYNKNPYDCRFTSIGNLLLSDLDAEEKLYFQNRLINYFEEVFHSDSDLDPFTKKLVIITHEYLGHKSGEFSSNVGTFVEESINLSKNSTSIVHYPIKISDYPIDIQNDLWKEDQIHLKDEYFPILIFPILEKEIQNSVNEFN